MRRNQETLVVLLLCAFDSGGAECCIRTPYAPDHADVPSDVAPPGSSAAFSVHELIAAGTAQMIRHTASAGCSHRVANDVAIVADLQVGSSASKDCSCLTNGSVPSNWTCLGKGIFQGYGSLPTISIPQPVPPVGSCFCHHDGSPVSLRSPPAIDELAAILACLALLLLPLRARVEWPRSVQLGRRWLVRRPRPVAATAPLLTLLCLMCAGRAAGQGTICSVCSGCCDGTFASSTMYAPPSPPAPPVPLSVLAPFTLPQSCHTFCSSLTAACVFRRDMDNQGLSGTMPTELGLLANNNVMYFYDNSLSDAGCFSGACAMYIETNNHEPSVGCIKFYKNQWGGNHQSNTVSIQTRADCNGGYYSGWEEQATFSGLDTGTSAWATISTTPLYGAHCSPPPSPPPDSTPPAPAPPSEPEQQGALPSPSPDPSPSPWPSPSGGDGPSWCTPCDCHKTGATSAMFHYTPEQGPVAEGCYTSATWAGGRTFATVSDARAWANAQDGGGANLTTVCSGTDTEGEPCDFVEFLEACDTSAGCNPLSCFVSGTSAYFYHPPFSYNETSGTACYYWDGGQGYLDAPTYAGGTCCGTNYTAPSEPEQQGALPSPSPDPSPSPWPSPSGGDGPSWCTPCDCRKTAAAAALTAAAVAAPTLDPGQRPAAPPRGARATRTRMGGASRRRRRQPYVRSGRRSAVTSKRDKAGPAGPRARYGLWEPRGWSLSVVTNYQDSRIKCVAQYSMGIPKNLPHAAALWPARGPASRWGRENPRR